jgi:hypothetical protein
VQKLAMGRFGQVDGGATLEKKLGKSAGMVGVLVGDEDGVQPVEPPVQRLEPAKGFPTRKPGIEEQARPVRFEQRRVAGTSRS